MIRPADIHSVTDFTRNVKSYIQQIKTSKNPMALTVNGDAQVVVQDAESFQSMMDELQQTRFIAAMREAEVAVKNGETQEWNVAVHEIRQELDL
jgi:PHD/YefM family antitoxin component YafN of YafNO toxin-antitoxin module